MHLQAYLRSQNVILYFCWANQAQKLFDYPTRYYSTTRLLSSLPCPTLPYPKVKSHYPSGPDHKQNMVREGIPNWGWTWQWKDKHKTHLSNHGSDPCQRFLGNFHPQNLHLHTTHYTESRGVLSLNWPYWGSSPLMDKQPWRCWMVQHCWEDYRRMEIDSCY